MISTIMDVARLRPERRRLRRKPQKLDDRPDSCQISCADTTEHESLDIKSLFRWRKSKYDAPTIQEIPCPTASDIVDDRKWAEQPTKIEPPHRDNRPPIQPTFSSMNNDEPIPEFAHLRISNRKIDRTVRDNPEPVRPISFPAAPTYRPRRYAKTPVSRIGQLEGAAALRRSATVREVSNVELIAESYRALLEPCYSVFKDTPTELPRTEEQFEKLDSPTSLLRIPTTPSKPRAGSFEHTSPGSDDGTLVGSEEGTICSRSIQHSPERFPVLREHEASAPPESARSTPAPGNPSLEISLDLLTQELSSAVLGTHLRPNTGPSALQIWVMIEAYEKLRDQLVETQAENDQTIVTMFDTWLKALHRIHDQMTGNKL